MLENKIKNAIENKRLKLIEGKKNWYSYFLLIQELIWSRNNHDGYLIDVYDKQYGNHLSRIMI